MLYTFVESFQGQYKDGTNGTRDFRMFSASFLIFRVLLLFLFLNHHRSTFHTAEMQIFFFLCASCFHAITRPYKLSFMNNIDIVILFLLGVLTLVTTTSVVPLLADFILGTTLLLLIPHMILIFYICQKLANKIYITQCLKRKYKTLKRYMQATRPTREAEADVEAQSDTGSLPDRLVNPGEYEPVLPTTGEHTAAEHTENKKTDNEKLKGLIPVYTYGSIS